MYHHRVKRVCANVLQYTKYTKAHVRRKTGQARNVNTQTRNLDRTTRDVNSREKVAKTDLDRDARNICSSTHCLGARFQIHFLYKTCKYELAVKVAINNQI